MRGWGHVIDPRTNTHMHKHEAAAPREDRFEKVFLSIWWHMLRRSLPDFVLLVQWRTQHRCPLANGLCLRYAVGVWKMRERQAGRRGCRDPSSRRRGRKALLPCWAWLSVSASSSTSPFWSYSSVGSGWWRRREWRLPSDLASRETGRACWFIICVVKLMLRWW